jgi:hypothetical protein
VLLEIPMKPAYWAFSFVLGETVPDERNTHDVSPEQLDRKFEQRLQSAMHETIFEYEPFTPLELCLAKAVGVQNPPQYFPELLRFQR